MKNLIAQTPTSIVNFEELGKSIPGLKKEFYQGASGVYPILSTVLKFVYVIAGLILLFSLISGGFKMMTGASDEKKIIEAKSGMTNALIGFVVLFLSYWIVQIVGYVLGVKFF